MKTMILALLLATGCSAPCSVVTDPAGARVFVDGEYLGDTPVTLELGNRQGDAYGWGFTDHRTLTLVEGGEYHSVLLKRHDSYGIPFWPESVRYSFERASAKPPISQSPPAAKPTSGTPPINP